jgi:cbb3-type cytochrome oxidase subunit 3
MRRWRRTLARRIALSLLVKLLLLFAIWWFFFSPAHRPHVDASAAASRIAVPASAAISQAVRP